MNATDAIGHTRSLSPEQRRLFPNAARLEAWRLHCQESHGASYADYRRAVIPWHSQNHTDCDWRYVPPTEEDR